MGEWISGWLVENPGRAGPGTDFWAGAWANYALTRRTPVCNLEPCLGKCES
jgi:hypothetical protein